MKKILILLFSVVTVSYANGQPKPDMQPKPTTEEEYNYGITGYKLQLQMKLHMRKGYKIEDLTAVERGVRKCSFKSLFREGEKQPCAVIMIYDRPRVNPEYFCLPTSDASAELWDKFYISLRSDTENEQERFHFFSFAIAEAAMKKN